MSPRQSRVCREFFLFSRPQVFVNRALTIRGHIGGTLVGRMGMGQSLRQRKRRGPCLSALKCKKPGRSRGSGRPQGPPRGQRSRFAAVALKVASQMGGQDAARWQSSRQRAALFKGALQSLQFLNVALCHVHERAFFSSRSISRPVTASLSAIACVFAHDNASAKFRSVSIVSSVIKSVLGWGGRAGGEVTASHRLAIVVTTNMRKSITVNTKKRGRPFGQEFPVAVQVRLSKNQAAALDRWRGDRSRSEAIRQLIEQALAKPQKRRIPSGELVWLRRSLEPGGYRHIVKQFDEQFAAMQSLKGMLMIADCTNPQKHRIYVCVPEASRQSYPHFRRVRASDIPADAEFLAGDESKFIDPRPHE